MLLKVLETNLCFCMYCNFCENIHFSKKAKLSPHTHLRSKGPLYGSSLMKYYGFTEFSSRLLGHVLVLEGILWCHLLLHREILDNLPPLFSIDSSCYTPQKWTVTLFHTICRSRLRPGYIWSCGDCPLLGVMHVFIYQLASMKTLFTGNNARHFLHTKHC